MTANHFDGPRLFFFFESSSSFCVVRPGLSVFRFLKLPNARFFGFSAATSGGFYKGGRSDLANF